MELALKRPDRLVPEYSLTGDLLSYQRCALQYRYYNGSALPPSRPVQMWYGEFIHGMFESAFGLWSENAGRLPFPWPCTPISDAGPPEAPPPGLPANDIRVIGWPIEEALMQQGKRARSRRARISAYRRADAAINMLGPHLFPLIADAEQKVIGTRTLSARSGGLPLRSERYALHGVIDVLTNVQLANAAVGNIIRDTVQTLCPDLSGMFEVIVDYKGSHRPDTDDPHWDLGRWQVQTYAWLRQKQQLSFPVAAGILIYVNELAPNSGDMRRLKSAIDRNRTDVAPVRGDPDYYVLRTWTPGSVPHFSEDFRFRRAIRVIPVDEASIVQATSAFDDIVLNIEERVMREASNGSIMGTWEPNCGDEETCAACDFRYFCASPLARRSARLAAAIDEDDDRI
jgi:CRISPR/Cas system-associated exonuclease Cas4 (RecB family)